MKYSISALGGYELVCPDGDWLGRSLQQGQPYEHKLLTIAAALAQQGLFVDAGANIGNHTIYMAKAGCSVVAIEPNPEVRKYLTSNVQRNKLDHSVDVRSCGLWSQSGSGTLAQQSVTNTGMTQIVPNGGGIELVTLDSLGLAPDVLKVDVEGLEVAVLEGARETLSKYHPAIFIESHTHLRKISRLLGAMGYSRVGRSFAASPTFLFVAQAKHHRTATPFVAEQRREWAATRIKRIAGKIPGISPGCAIAKKLSISIKKTVHETLAVRSLRSCLREPFRSRDDSSIVVSLTSFPARIDHAWIPIETMFQQDEPPQKVVLVLAESEFAGRKLPTEIRQQEERGLTILWTDRNTRSYKKLLPTRQAFPDATIVTIDDDVLYGPRTLSSLTAAANECPGTVVGHRGWVVTGGRRELLPYRDWPNAHRDSPGDRVLLTGNGGILYPPHVLPKELLADIDLAESLCPTGDDIWFWAVSRVAGVPALCLGNSAVHGLRCQRRTARLATLNRQGHNDFQLRRVFEHFGFFGTLMADDL